MRLGDLVYYITYYTGIHWLVKKISKALGKDCGCDQRRNSWNDINRAMRIEDQEAWIDFKANVSTKLTKDQYRLLCTLHARYLNHRYHEPCSCRPKTLVMWIKDIDNIYNKIND